jgi:hypothetical protein
MPPDFGGTGIIECRRYVLKRRTGRRECHVVLRAVEDDNTLFTCCLVWGDNGLHQMAAGIALVEVAISKTQTASELRKLR